jgi:lysophospholipase L1-like esterase
MALRYVALGDSYTIGTSVSADQAWPSQLAEGRSADGQRQLELVANLAANGRTSKDVLDDQLPRLARLGPDFVSLLIGVNDVVQGVPLDRYRANAGRVLDDILAHLPVARLVVVTTPDYTVTPAGARFGDPQVQRARILAVNAAMVELADARRVAVVDIFDLSQRAGSDPSLLARDGLHPSGRQYALWLGRIRPVVAGLLERN